MHQFIGFTISGLVTAGIYAIVACGLTLTYATTGIFNWAHGSLVAVGAFTYWQLSVGWGWPAWLAVATCLLVVGPVLGTLLEVAIMHRLEGTSEATRMVVTLALLLGLLAGINWIWKPSKLRLVDPIANRKVLTIFDQRIPYNDIAVISVALLVAVALRFLLYRTRAGVTMRGTVDDRGLATVNGASVTRTAALSWSVGTTLAVLAGILVAPRAALSASTLALLIVNAYAAAIIGRLRSLPMTFLGAIVLGLANDYGQGYIGSRQDFPANQYLIGMINVLPVIVLFVALQLVPQDRLRGGRALRIKEVSHRPTWSGATTLAITVVVGAIALAPLVAKGDLNTMTKIWGLALVALSLVPLVGWAGRLSVCPLSFAAIGAIVVSHLGHGGNPLFILVGSLVAGLVGALVSLTAIRLAGLYLALATAAFAVMLDNWIFKLPPFTMVLRIPFTDITLYRQKIEVFPGGNLAITRFRLLGVDTRSDHAFFVFGAVVFALVGLAVVALRRSDVGLRLIALKDSPVGYATLGLNRRLTTVMVFGLSGAIAGLGGALFGAAIQRPSPDVFNFFSGLGVLVAIVLAGVNSIGATVFAGAFLGGPTLANLFPSLSQLSSSLIGFAGINLGKNPNGAAADARRDFGPVFRSRALLGGGFAVVAAAYVLTITDVIGNWAFVGVVLVVAIGLPALAKVALGTAVPPSDRDRAVDSLSAAPEELGLGAPISTADLVVLDRHLGIDTIGLVGADRGA